jgi:outer membrane receptor protein involved in Fe transport
VYFIRWSNIQVQETTPDGAFVYQGNAGEAKVKGVEFEFTAHPMEHLAATFAGSYQDAYLAQGATAPQYTLNPTLGLTGDTVPNVPKVQLNLGLNYRRLIASGWEGTAAADVTYRDAEDSYFSSNGFNIPLAPYTPQDPDALLTVQPRTIGLTVTRTF